MMNSTLIDWISWFVIVSILIVVFVICLDTDGDS